MAITKLNRFLPFFSLLYDMMVAPFVKTVTQAAATSVHCCVAPKLLASHDGGFFDNCKPTRVPEIMCSRTLQVCFACVERLIALGRDLVSVVPGGHVG